MSESRPPHINYREIKRKLDEMSLEKHGSEEYRRIMEAIRTYGRPTPESDVINPDDIPEAELDLVLHEQMKSYYRA